MENATAIFAYDAVGNTLMKHYQGTPPQTMSYDAASRIVTSTSGSVATRFTFDGAGNQILENSAGALTTYSFDPANRNLRVQYPSGTLSTYTWIGYSGLRRTNIEPGERLFTTIWDDRAKYLGEI